MASPPETDFLQRRDTACKSQTMSADRNHPNLPRNLILIGMPGSGKSTIGVLLAKEAGYAFMDTDLLIQEREHCLLQDIVDAHGHLELRRIESEVCRSLDVSHQVIATGGSVVYCPLAMAHLATIGDLIWLKVPYPEIARRIDNFASRGLAKADGQTLEDLFNERQPLYRQYGQSVIPCEGLSADQIARSIISRY